MNYTSIQNLVKSIKKGEKSAFKKMYDFYAPKIYAFAISQVKNHELAEEFVQEVFLKLWELREKLDESKNLKSFVFKITINLIYDFIRKTNLEIAFEQNKVLNPNKMENNTWEQVVYNDMLTQVNRLIEKMPAQQQKIFRLSKVEGLKNDEIASKLQLSKRTVENQLYRAIHFLKSNLNTKSLVVIAAFYILFI